MAEQFDWYESRKQGLGYDFLAQVRSAFLQVEENPLRFAPIYGNVRRALVRRFPFKVFYILEAGTVEVIGLVHARRDPHVWRKRVP